MKCSRCLISLPSFTLHDVSRTKWLWITLWASTKAQSDFLFAFLFFFFYIRAPHCGRCHSMEKVEIFFDMLSFCLDVVRCSSPVSCISVNCHMSTRFLVPTVYISAWSIFMAESGITTLSQMNELNLQKKKKKGIMVLIICGFFHCGWLVNI